MLRSYKYINFHPWIGDNYGDSSIKGSPVLLLGWSHYKRSKSWTTSSDFGSNSTVEIVREHIEDGNDTRRGFWAKCRQAVVGGRPDASDQQRASFWHSVAFYNYIQEALDDASDLPTMWQAKSARDAFLEVLKVHKPKTIIVLGKTLWETLPYDGHSGDPVACSGIEGGSIKTWHYPCDQSDFAVASWIRHPSARNGWDAEFWHTRVSSLLERKADTFCAGCEPFPWAA